MRTLFPFCVAPACLWAAMTLSSSSANAVFWRGLTAPTNIDYHGYTIIKEPRPSPCQWIRVNGYYSANAYASCCPCFV
ncbi:hypothetical protein ACVME8_007951 [Bradyrhizobium diazoefficiens]